MNECNKIKKFMQRKFALHSMYMNPKSDAEEDILQVTNRSIYFIPTNLRSNR